MGISTIPGGHLPLCMGANVGSPRPATHLAVLPVQVVGMELQINHLTAGPANAGTFGTEDSGVLEL